MYSLLRGACYKCGNIGHYAEICSSAERLCYNCKKPGHESNSCSAPRTTETKQCYHCQGLGHVQAVCPTLRIIGAGINGRCYTCGQLGHLARTCTSQNTTSAIHNIGHSLGVSRGWSNSGFVTRGFLPGFRFATCYKCGQPNHFARDCQTQATKCYACGKFGHISRVCTAPNGGTLNISGKICYGCGESGHISRNCSQTSDNRNLDGPDNVNSGASVAPAT